jgi:tetratricopeptide (TPR) repeat protein
MHRSILFAVLFLSAAVPVSGWAMGGGGYGGGGGMPTMGGMGTDDYTMALRLIHREKYAEAVPYLDRALQERPYNADILNYLGFTHRMLGDYPGSLDFYQRALERDPDHKGAHEYLGELFLNMHQVENARAQLAELARICPNDCDERDTLTKSIATYEAASAAPAQAAAPAATPSPAQ